jgi:hypothetical protein
MLVASRPRRQELHIHSTQGRRGSLGKKDEHLSISVSRFSDLLTWGANVPDQPQRCCAGRRGRGAPFVHAAR